MIEDTNRPGTMKMEIPVKGDARDTNSGSEYRFALSPAAAILELDTTSFEQMYQVVVGYRRIQINANVFRLLGFLRSARKRAEVSSFLRNLVPDEDPEQLSERVLGELASKGIVVEIDQAGRKICHIAEAVQPRRHPLALHVRLLKREQILPITSRLKHLFASGPATILVSVVILCHATFFLTDKLALAHHVARSGSLPAGEWLFVVFGIYLSLLFHELGHCSACERFGAEHGEIGAGIYFIYPVFYADVAQCWSLPRMRRAVVDWAGVYFQLLLSSLGCVVWIITGHRLAKIFIHSSLLTAIVNMNPFLRLDGYWALADLTGIPGLYRAANEAIRYVFKRLKARGAVERPELLRRPVWVLVILAVYCIGSVLFFSYFAVKITWVVMPRIVLSLPRNLAEIWTRIVRLEFSGRLAQLLIVSLFLVMAALGAGRFLMRLGRRLWRGVLARPLRAAFQERQARRRNCGV